MHRITGRFNRGPRSGVGEPSVAHAPPSWPEQGCHPRRMRPSRALPLGPHAPRPVFPPSNNQLGPLWRCTITSEVVALVFLEHPAFLPSECHSDHDTSFAYPVPMTLIKNSKSVVRESAAPQNQSVFAQFSSVDVGQS